MANVNTREGEGMVCSACHSTVVANVCTICGKRGGHERGKCRVGRFVPPSSSEDDASDDDDPDDEEARAIKLMAGLHETEHHKTEVKLQRQMASALADVPDVDVDDVKYAHAMEEGHGDERALHFASRREILVREKVERVMHKAKTMTKQIVVDPFAVTKRAQRQDPAGKELEMGAWSAMDFRGQYHLDRIAKTDAEHMDAPRYPIAGTNVAVDQWRKDRFAEKIEGVDKAAARAKHLAMKNGKQEALRLTFAMKVDFDMRFANRAKEIEGILGEKDTHMAKIQELADAQNAMESEKGKKAGTVDGAASQAAMEELHRDVEANHVERVALCLAAQFEDEDATAGMSEWEAFQHRAAMARMKLYKVDNIDGADALYGNTALFKAVGSGRTELVALLLKYGANPSILNFLGESPVHHCWRSWDMAFVNAAQKRERSKATVDILRMLVDAGADLNVQDTSHKETPLHLAARYGPTDIVQYLLARKAAPEVLNHRGERPYDIALRFKGKRSHGHESANLLQRWRSLEKNLKLNEFQHEWTMYLRDKNVTLVGNTAADVLVDLKNDERKAFGTKLARDPGVPFTDSIANTFDPPAEVQAADKQHELDVEHAKYADKKEHEFRKEVARVAHDDRPLGCRIDDYLHRDANPGFVTREQMAVIRGEHQPAAAKEAEDKYCVTKEEAERKRRHKKWEAGAGKRAEKMALLKSRSHLRWRRLQAGQEVLKDLAEPGRELTFGRPAAQSSIWRSGSSMRHNLIQKNPAVATNRIKAEHLFEPKTALQLLEEKKADDEAKAADDDSVAYNAPFALPAGNTHRQVFTKVGRNWLVAAERRRPDFGLASRDTTDPWKFIDGKWDHPCDKHNDGYEDRFSKLGMEGFDKIMGKDPNMTTKFSAEHSTL